MFVCNANEFLSPNLQYGEFHYFVTEWGINHHITSPHHPQSNGTAESGVKIMKKIIIKCKNLKLDPYPALMEQRNTPRKDTGLSPAEMMFGRRLRTMLPRVTSPAALNEKHEARKQSIKNILISELSTYQGLRQTRMCTSSKNPTICGYQGKLNIKITTIMK